MVLSSGSREYESVAIYRKGTTCANARPERNLSQRNIEIVPLRPQPARRPLPRATRVPPTSETAMNDETFNLSIRKFLKMVGINSQREIEQAVTRAIADHSITGTESFPAKVTLEIPGLKVNVKFDGEIRLQ
jgi:hypothetical protein